MPFCVRSTVVVSEFLSARSVASLTGTSGTGASDRLRRAFWGIQPDARCGTWQAPSRRWWDRAWSASLTSPTQIDPVGRM